MKKPAIDIRGKPKRPLSAYNIFYRLSRKLFISSNLKKEEPLVFVTSIFDDISSMDKRLLLEMALGITKQYRIVTADKEGLIKNIKPFGILGFKDLTRVIAAQWTKLPQSTKSILESCSLEDKKVYTDLRNKWKSDKDAKIRKKLDAQVLCEDSGVSSCHNLEDLQAQSRSSVSFPKKWHDEIFNDSSTSLLSAALRTPSKSVVVDLISNEKFTLQDKNLQSRSFETNTSTNSIIVSSKTDQKEEVTNCASLSPNCCLVKPDQVLYSQDQSSRNASLEVGQHQLYNDLKSVPSPTETNQTDFLDLRETLLNDVFEGENLHDFFILMLK